MGCDGAVHGRRNSDDNHAGYDLIKRSVSGSGRLPPRYGERDLVEGAERDGERRRGERERQREREREGEREGGRLKARV